MKNIDIKELTSETLSLSVSAEICISCFFFPFYLQWAILRLILLITLISFFFEKEEGGGNCLSVLQNLLICHTQWQKLLNNLSFFLFHVFIDQPFIAIDWFIKAGWQHCLAVTFAEKSHLFLKRKHFSEHWLLEESFQISITE